MWSQWTSLGLELASAWASVVEGEDSPFTRGWLCGAGAYEVHPPPGFPGLDGHSPFQCPSFCSLHIDCASVPTVPLMANQDQSPPGLQGFYCLRSPRDGPCIMAAKICALSVLCFLFCPVPVIGHLKDLWYQVGLRGCSGPNSWSFLERWTRSELFQTLNVHTDSWIFLMVGSW